MLDRGCYELNRPTSHGVFVKGYRINSYQRTNNEMNAFYYIAHEIIHCNKTIHLYHAKNCLAPVDCPVPAHTTS